jgi:hypothetical protein
MTPKERKQVRSLIKVYDGYIELLNAELEEIIVLATLHGWKSHRYEDGLKMRNRIAELKRSISQ